MLMGNLCHFARFALQPAFQLDLELLAERYRQAAKAVHPDRFADAQAREQRLALEESARLNDAYQTLKSPSQRARYLLSLRGANLPLETTVSDDGFLMQQMQWREELEELQDEADAAGLQSFKQRLKQAQADLYQGFAQAWEHNQNLEGERLVRRMQFLDKLAVEVRQLEERLDD